MIYQRKYATLLAGATLIGMPILKRGVVDYAVGADWTPAAGDVKVAIDNAAPANITNLPTALTMGNSAVWLFILTAAELTGKNIQVMISDSATKAIEDQFFTVETTGNGSAMYPTDVNADNTDAENRFLRAVKTNVLFTVGGGSTTTSVVTSAMDPAASVTDQFKGRVILFAKDTTTAALRGQGSVITSSTAGGVLTVDALSNAPASGDTGVIV